MGIIMIKSQIINGEIIYFETFKGKIIREVSREFVENYRKNFFR